MNRIGILTSGGDAPGMNAAIRAAVRTASVRGVEMVGITEGYTGLLAGLVHTLGPRAVSNTIQRGGTILGTSRCEEFRNPEGRRLGAERLRHAGIDGLIVIGGDGSFRGADRLATECGIAVIGVPGTIDNDISGTDATIGYDTAVNTAIDAIDKIRDTAASHSRIFFIEVMGRHAGFIALEAAIGGGAEEVILPEEEVTIELVCERLRDGMTHGKSSSIVIVAEGHPLGGAVAIAERVEAILPVDTKTTILGHIQRGGRPTARDRVLASRLGAAAVDRLLASETGVMVGEVAGSVMTTPLPDTWNQRKPLDAGLLRLARELSA
ncbi:MAG TPA: 6-phosphofructokinase [Candidatus Eisenbacteria bacterium]